MARSRKFSPKTEPRNSSFVIAPLSSLCTSSAARKMYHFVFGRPCPYHQVSVNFLPFFIDNQNTWERSVIIMGIMLWNFFFFLYTYDYCWVGLLCYFSYCMLGDKYRIGGEFGGDFSTEGGRWSGGKRSVEYNFVKLKFVKCEKNATIISTK